MRLIGINGFKGSGKDTTYAIIKQVQEGADANIISPHLRAERRAFADNLKLMAAKTLGYEGTDDNLIDCMDEFKANGWVIAGQSIPRRANAANQHTISGRKYLQLLGGKAREVFGDRFWIDQVLPNDGFAFERVWETRGRRQSSPMTFGMPAIGCVTDVRYANEAEAILNAGGEVWEVVRPGLESDGDASEQPLPRELVTVSVNNDKDIVNLYKHISSLVHG